MGLHNLQSDGSLISRNDFECCWKVFEGAVVVTEGVWLLRSIELDFGQFMWAN